MTLDSSYVDTLSSGDQVKKEFVCGKGHATHISIIRLLRSGMTVSQLERLLDDEVRERYLRMKSDFIEQWDKVSGTQM